MDTEVEHVKAVNAWGHQIVKTRDLVHRNSKGNALIFDMDDAEPVAIFSELLDGRNHHFEDGKQLLLRLPFYCQGVLQNAHPLAMNWEYRNIHGAEVCYIDEVPADAAKYK